MKAYLYRLLVLACLLPAAALAQPSGNLQIAAPGGERMTLSLNGEITSDVPNPRIRVLGLGAGTYDARICVASNILATAIFTQVNVQAGYENSFQVVPAGNGAYNLQAQPVVYLNNSYKNMQGSNPYQVFTGMSSYFNPNGANVRISSGLNAHLTLTMNGLPVIDLPARQLFLRGMEGGTYNARLTISEAGVSTAVYAQLLANPGYETQYTVTKDNWGRFFIQQTGAVPIPGYVPGRRNPYGPNTNPVNPNPYNPNPTPTPTPTPNPIPDPSPNPHHHHNPPNPQPQPQPELLPGYTGPIGCMNPMSDVEFRQLKETVAGQSFESTKLTVAKEALTRRCLFVNDLKELVELFSFDSNKLEMAKYGYPYVYDKANFYTIANSLSFESSRRELMDFISKQPK